MSSVHDLNSMGFMKWPGAGGGAHYSEGLAVGYQGYDQLGIEPLFPFGYGRSYTSFTSSELEVEPEASAGTPIQVSFTLTNSGERAGVEIAQGVHRVRGCLLAGHPPHEHAARSAFRREVTGSD